MQSNVKLIKYYHINIIYQVKSINIIHKYTLLKNCACVYNNQYYHINIIYQVKSINIIHKYTLLKNYVYDNGILSY